MPKVFIPKLAQSRSERKNEPQEPQEVENQIGIEAASKATKEPLPITNEGKSQFKAIRGISVFQCGVKAEPTKSSSQPISEGLPKSAPSNERVTVVKYEDKAEAPKKVAKKTGGKTKDTLEKENDTTFAAKQDTKVKPQRKRRTLKEDEVKKPPVRKFISAQILPWQYPQKKKKPIKAGNENAAKDYLGYTFHSNNRSGRKVVSDTRPVPLYKGTTAQVNLPYALQIQLYHKSALLFWQTCYILSCDSERFSLE